MTTAATTPVERGTTRRNCWRCRYAPHLPGENARACTNHSAPGFGRSVPKWAVCPEFARPPGRAACTTGETA